MAEPPYSPDTKPPAMPRWVKVFAIVAVLVILLFVVLLITGGHRPRRHSTGTHALHLTSQTAEAPSNGG
jgi:hypothetical protein